MGKSWTLSLTSLPLRSSEWITQTLRHREYMKYRRLSCWGYISKIYTLYQCFSSHLVVKDLLCIYVQFIFHIGELIFFLCIMFKEISPLGCWGVLTMSNGCKTSLFTNSHFLHLSCCRWVTSSLWTSRVHGLHFE